MMSRPALTRFLGLWLGMVLAHAQTASVGWSVTNRPATLVVGETLSSVVTLTNMTVGVIIPTLTVQSTFSGPVTMLAVTNASGTYRQVTNGVAFSFTTVNPALPPISVSFSVSPLQAGLLTNTTTLVSTSGISFTNLTNYSIVLTSTVLPPRGDLGVSFTESPTGVLVQDLVSYSMVVTNAGPVAATNIVLTNRLSPGLKLVSVAPASVTYSSGTNSLLLGIPALQPGGSFGVEVTVQATSSGLAGIAASIGSTDLTDTNAVNDLALDPFQVALPGTNRLVVVSQFPQRYNPQTGLMEEVVRVTNPGPNPVSAFRLAVGGLTNTLFNATGTNGSTPFVVVNGGLAAGSSVNLLLEYGNPSRTPGAEPALTALESPPASTALPTGVGVVVNRQAVLPGHRVLLEFPSTAGNRYVVLFSGAPDAASATWQAVIPRITASADRTQWIDYGPPQTPVAPSTPGARYYRVLQLP